MSMLTFTSDEASHTSVLFPFSIHEDRMPRAEEDPTTRGVVRESSLQLFEVGEATALGVLFSSDPSIYPIAHGNRFSLATGEVVVNVSLENCREWVRRSGRSEVQVTTYQYPGCVTLAFIEGLPKTWERPVRGALPEPLANALRLDGRSLQG